MSSSSSSWSCSACTYKNSSKMNICDMCDKPRNNDNGRNNNAAQQPQPPGKKPKKTLKQRTLFGGIVDLTTADDKKTSTTTAAPAAAAPPPPPPPKKKDAASRKRKLTSSSTSTPEFTSTSDVVAMLRKEKLMMKNQKQQRQRHNIQFSYYCKQNLGSSTVASKPNDRQDMINNVLKNVFDLTELRPLQKLSIATSLSCKNQLIVLATGGGKSLCYQLPACLLGGVTIVISPLIALMQDQVLALQQKFNVPAACISSSQKESDNKRILDSLTQKQPPNDNSGGNNNNNNNPCPVLLYITPESIQTDRMRRILKSLNEQNRLALFAVDEAHCLSSWGHDFRPAYRKLSWLRQQFPKVPVMACTATATPQVIKDIQSILKLENAALHKGSFDRPNIFYKVKYKDTYTNSMKSALQDLVDYIKKWHDNARMENKHCSGIVYVHKRDDTKSIATALQKARIKAAAYHAGLKDAERNQVQNDWSNNTIQVAVATVAFGMGIDLAHVRYVIHWTLPKTLEGFYQESGRAGRDGLPSQSVLYYSQDDARKFQWLIGQQAPKKDKDPEATKKQQQRKLHALEDMVNYCMKPQCRRNTLIKHFGGTPVECDESCDYCRNPSKVERAIQLAAVLASSGHNHTSGKIYGGGRGGKNNNNAWDGQWTGLHDDENNSNDWGGGGKDVVNGLRITGPIDYGGGEFSDDDNDQQQQKLPARSKKKPAARFTTASAVLARYEAMECRENNGTSNGFVRFRSKKDGGDGSSGALVQESIQVPSIQIPEHLRVAASSKTSKKKKSSAPPPKEKTSADHAAEADKLRAEIAKLDAEREERMKKLMSKYKKQNVNNK